MTPSLPEASFRMPPEWAQHECTWLSWPHNPETWPEGLDGAERTMAAAVRALLNGERVDVNVLDAAHGRHVASLVGPVDDLPFPLRLHTIPTNDAWCRDHGAIIVASTNGQSRKAIAWRYNAWGGKYPPYDLDQQVAGRMGAILDIPIESVEMVLEGGSVEIDEHGRLMTTASCLLNPNRNPSYSRERIESMIHDHLGATEILWLAGEIAGDDTDGHIDNLARFVGGNRIVAASESDPSDPNYASLRDHVAALRSHRFADGSSPIVVEMPMPKPVFAGSDRLPASYCNFYIGNSVVLLPTYGCPQDDNAAEILAGCFPTRRIVGLDCRDVVRGLGAFHCLTQQVPL